MTGHIQKMYIQYMKKAVFVLLSVALAGCSFDKTDTILTLSQPDSLSVLHGKDSAQVADLLGTPSVIRTEGTFQSWVFRAPDCALFVFFDEQGKASYTEAKGSCDREIAEHKLAAKKGKSS